VLTGDADILIERHGKPVAVMIPVEDYEELLDELVDLRAARRAAKEYEEWKKDPSTGRPYDQVRAELVRDDLLDE
jgi:prevent-host-death family protein